MKCWFNCNTSSSRMVLWTWSQFSEVAYFRDLHFKNTHYVLRDSSFSLLWFFKILFLLKPMGIINRTFIWKTWIYRVNYPEWINFADIGYSETVEEQDRIYRSFCQKESTIFLGVFWRRHTNFAVESEKIRIHSKPWEMCLALQKTYGRMHVIWLHICHIVTCGVYISSTRQLDTQNPRWGWWRLATLHTGEGIMMFFRPFLTIRFSANDQVQMGSSTYHSEKKHIFLVKDPMVVISWGAPPPQ